MDLTIASKYGTVFAVPVSLADRFLDPDSDSVTLATLSRTTAVVGRELRLELVQLQVYKTTYFTGTRFREFPGMILRLRPRTPHVVGTPWRLRFASSFQRPRTRSVCITLVAKAFVMSCASIRP